MQPINYFIAFISFSTSEYHDNIAENKFLTIILVLNVFTITKSHTQRRRISTDVGIGGLVWGWEVEGGVDLES